MAEFDFSTLNSTDLENLACDLLNAQEHSIGSDIIFKTFREGKDRGIDFLYSTKDFDFEIVGQVKHYISSGFKVLLNDLHKKEKPKVRNLSPKRYILVTSVDLSVQNTLDIAEAMSPFLSSNDIYGKKDVNRLLDVFPNVLSAHFKLWFSSTAVLQKVLNYEMEGRTSEFLEFDIKRRLRLYVETPSLSKARECLNKGNILILQGEPGVGKTTTAEILLYELIQQDYHLTYIYDEIKEAERTYVNDNSKQVFYFDDFLGSTEEEIRKSRGAESAILRIFRMVSRRPNKKLIVSTRSFILNSALEASERLRNTAVAYYVSTVEIKKLSVEQRFQMLENHIDQSDVKHTLKDVLRELRIQNFILHHPNFSPRSVEFITSQHHVGHFKEDEFRDFIISNFNYPDEIWRLAYEQQIDEADRLFLNTMVSFGDSVYISILEKAFDARVIHEVAFGGYSRKINAFQRSLRRLTDGFIVKGRHFDNGYYQFINPSLIDFLVNYIKNIDGEGGKISEAAVTLDQLTPRLFPITQRRRRVFISAMLSEKLLFNWQLYVDPDQEEKSRFVLALILFYYVNDPRKDGLVREHLTQIRNWDFVEGDTDMHLASKLFLEELEPGEVFSAVTSHCIGLFVAMICGSENSDEALEVLQMVINRFKPDFVLQMSDEQKTAVEEIFSSLIESYMSERVEDILSYAHAISAAQELEESIFKLKELLVSYGIDTSLDSGIINQHDWSTIQSHNYFAEEMAKND